MMVNIIRYPIPIRIGVIGIRPIRNMLQILTGSMQNCIKGDKAKLFLVAWVYQYLPSLSRSII